MNLDVGYLTITPKSYAKQALTYADSFGAPTCMDRRGDAGGRGKAVARASPSPLYLPFAYPTQGLDFAALQCHRLSIDHA